MSKEVEEALEWNHPDHNEMECAKMDRMHAVLASEVRTLRAEAEAKEERYNTLRAIELREQAESSLAECRKRLDSQQDTLAAYRQADISYDAMRKENATLTKELESLRVSSNRHIGELISERDALTALLEKKYEALLAVKKFSEHIYTNADHEFRDKHLAEMLDKVVKALTPRQRRGGL